MTRFDRHALRRRPPLRATTALAALLAGLSLALPAAASADPLSPVVRIDSGPSGETADRTPTFTFSSDDTGSFECRVDADSFTACSSPFKTATLSLGSHTFEVRGVGLLGLTRGQPASRSFRVVEPPPDDRDPPNTEITGGPKDRERTNDSTPSFTFRSNESGARFQCLVDSIREQDFFNCSSPYTLPELSEGTHAFAVRAIDLAGNKDATPEFVRFLVDAITDPPKCFGERATIVGSNGDDNLTGTRDSDVIVGADGNDRIDGGPGDDKICGGEGDDLLKGAGGDDQVAGRLGDDRVEGGGRSDRISGNAGNDELIAGSGKDKLSGNEGKDTLSGGEGKDFLNGGAGADQCDGGSGKDDGKGCERSIGIP